MTSAALGAAVVMGLGLSVLPARAAYVVTLTQVVDLSQPLGFDVVANGSGTINLTGLFQIPTSVPASSSIYPAIASIVTGAGNSTQYGPIIPFSFFGPSHLGPTARTPASTASGDLVGVDGTGLGSVYVPAGYTSGDLLSDTATYDNATFASLGVEPGTYAWGWATSPTAPRVDSFTLQVGVPEPSTWAMMLVGFALVLASPAFGPRKRKRP
jgi:hypothetical protein